MNNFSNIWNAIAYFLYGAAALMATCLNFLGIQQTFVYALGVALAFDWLCGFIKAYKYKELSSDKSKRGLMDKVLLMILPLVLALCFKAFKLEIALTIDIIFAVLTISEILSSMRHIIEMRTGKKVKETDGVTLLLKAIGGLFLKFVKPFIKVKKDD
jgi:toxin secretion/phage lysis holin